MCRERDVQLTLGGMLHAEKYLSATSKLRLFALLSSYVDTLCDGMDVA